MWFQLLVASALVAATHGLLEGLNVCTRQEQYETTIPVSVQQPYQVKSRQISKTQTLIKYRPVKECCTGYKPDSQGEQCVSVCAEKCVYGKCIAPNTCACDHGYGGAACEISCPIGKWGPHCQDNCNCRNGSTCKPLTGACDCAPGWRGETCEKPCAPGTFGEDCDETCQCHNNATCHHVSGACKCLTGFTGPLCEEKCPGKQQCVQNCRCQNAGKWNPLSGKCECTPGWTGEVCANRCPSGKWGDNCAKSCECANGASCHHVTGYCQCEAGYTGEKCQEACPLATWGVGCKNACPACLNGGECSARNGSCTCKPGWRGEHCQERACVDGKWGPRCDKDCECDPATTDMCDPWTGACDLRCENSGHCSPVKVCPKGYFGEHCMEPCNCSSEGYWVCDPVKDCVCQRGFIGDHRDFDHATVQACNCSSEGNCVCQHRFIGDHCDTHAAADDAPGSSNLYYTAGLVIMALLCAAAAILMLFYYCKRVRDRKKKIEDVYYTPDSNLQPDQKHFDNPVYTMLGSTRGEDSTTLLNNGTHILNNLGSASKVSNTTREKLRNSETGSSNSYEYPSNVILKNKATNPNLYHCSEDQDKLYHVYDEIRHKEGTEMEYDRLNHIPPANKWKPQYQKPNGVSTSQMPARKDSPTKTTRPLP